MAERSALGDVAQLVTDHAPVLYRYAYRLSGSAADAEDLTQEAFLIAQRKLGQVRDSQNVRAWLFTVLRNCYLKSCRQRLPRVLGDGDFDMDGVPGQVCQQPLDTEDLQRAINSLSDEFKVVVLMFYFEHRSYREIAELLDVPAGTVMSRLARSKAHLRRWLSEPADATIRLATNETTGSITDLKKPASVGH